MHLDILAPQQSDADYCQLGTHGNLVYEGILAQIQHRHYQPAFSTYLPLCQRFDKEHNQPYTTGETYA